MCHLRHVLAAFARELQRLPAWVQLLAIRLHLNDVRDEPDVAPSPFLAPLTVSGLPRSRQRRCTRLQRSVLTRWPLPTFCGWASMRWKSYWKWTGSVTRRASVWSRRGAVSTVEGQNAQFFSSFGRRSFCQKCKTSCCSTLDQRTDGSLRITSKTSKTIVTAQQCYAALK